MSIGEKVKQRRIELNLTQEELAKRMGYKSKTTIAKIESQSNDIPLSKVKKLADCLRTSPGILMGWEDDDTLATLEAQITYEPTALDRFVESISDFSDDEIQELNNYAAFIRSKRKEL